MKLTCPECTTQFLINPEVIGTNGRTVRCSSCSATWYVAAEPDALDLQDQLAETQAYTDIQYGQDIPQSASGTRAGSNTGLESNVFENNVLENAGAGLGDEKFDGDVGGALGEALGGGLGPHAVMRDRSERKKVRRRLFGVGMIWGVTIAILGTAALAAYMLRGPMTERFPVTLKIYEAFGISVPVAGLKLTVTGHGYGELDGQQILTVSGKIKNVDRKTRDVPLVKFSFKNADGNVIASWVAEPERSVLKANESLAFETQYPNPPVDAVSLDPSFVNEGEGGGRIEQGEMPLVTQ